MKTYCIEYTSLNYKSMYLYYLLLYINNNEFKTTREETEEKKHRE